MSQLKLCRNCVTCPPKAWGNTVIYGDTPTHVDVAEVFAQKDHAPKTELSAQRAAARDQLRQALALDGFLGWQQRQVATDTLEAIARAQQTGDPVLERERRALRAEAEQLRNRLLAAVWAALTEACGPHHELRQLQRECRGPLGELGGEYGVLCAAVTSPSGVSLSLARWGEVVKALGVMLDPPLPPSDLACGPPARLPKRVWDSTTTVTDPGGRPPGPRFALTER